MKASARLCTLLGTTLASLALAPGAFATTFSNPAPILIVDEAPASLYPSPAAVSGMVGEVTDLNVTLNGLTHTHLDDVGVLVEAPGGETLLLMNGVGPVVTPADPSSGVTDIDLTLDDGAATQLQNSVVPAAGSYRPANHSGLDSFTGAGPGSSYGNPAPGGTATLASTFGPIDPNGNWKLFVHDFAQDDVGQITGGWRLDVTTDGTDNTGPVTTITSGPSGPTSQTSAAFGFSANEAASFECKIDALAFAPCTAPKSYTALAEGSHTFSVRGTDATPNLGNTATRIFTVDLVDPPPPPAPPSNGGGATADLSPPIVSITKLTLNRKKRSAKLEFSGTDDVTAAGALSFTCMIDKQPAGPCSSPKAYKKLKPGKHTVEVRAHDAAGNSGAATKGFRIKKPK